MAHNPTQNLEQIYMDTAAGNRPDNLPSRNWLGREYAIDTVLPGATRESGVHQLNPTDEVGGYSLDGNGETVFQATVDAYDTRDPKNFEMLIKRPAMAARLDEQTKQYMGHVYGGEYGADPYVDRDYISDAPGLEG